MAPHRSPPSSGGSRRTDAPRTAAPARAGPGRLLALSPSAHRRGALDEVRDELAQGRPDTEAAVAIRSYGTGRLVVGIAGPVDRAMADRIGGLLSELDALSARELVLTLGLLTEWDRKLPRVLSRARMAHLVRGTQVELNDVPDALLVALDLGTTGQSASSFTVTDGDPLHS